MLVSRSLLNPQKGSTFSEQIVCYGLPYGGMGFFSHILIYHTVVCLAFGHSPFRPWKNLKHTTFDLLLGAVSLISACTMTIFTMVKCRSHWQLIAIAVWKFGMSFFSSAVAVHVSILLRRYYRTADGDDLESSTAMLHPKTLAQYDIHSSSTTLNAPRYNPDDQPRRSGRGTIASHRSNSSSFVPMLLKANGASGGEQKSMLRRIIIMIKPPGELSKALVWVLLCKSH